MLCVCIFLTVWLKRRQPKAPQFKTRRFQCQPSLSASEAGVMFHTDVSGSPIVNSPLTFDSIAHAGDGVGKGPAEKVQMKVEMADLGVTSSTAAMSIPEWTAEFNSDGDGDEFTRI